jgi:porphobilinogen deaminase
LAGWARTSGDDQTAAGSPTRLLTLTAAVFDPDGRDRIAVSLTGLLDEPEELGRRAAESLRDQGALGLMKRLP